MGLRDFFKRMGGGGTTQPSAGGVMDEDRFWKIIDDARTTARNDQARYVKSVRESLGRLSLGEIARFDTIFRELMASSYSWDLWGAAYLIRGGCSDDGFDYFRTWLISKGFQTFERAMDDPDSLAELDEFDNECEFESLLYVASEVYEAKAGQDMPRSSVEKPTEPEGEAWDEDDESALMARYPRLAERIG